MLGNGLSSNAGPKVLNASFKSDPNYVFDPVALTFIAPVLRPSPLISRIALKFVIYSHPVYLHACAVINLHLQVDRSFLTLYFKKTHQS